MKEEKISKCDSLLPPQSLCPIFFSSVIWIKQLNHEWLLCRGGCCGLAKEVHSVWPRRFTMFWLRRLAIKTCFWIFSLVFSCFWTYLLHKRRLTRISSLFADRFTWELFWNLLSFQYMLNILLSNSIIYLQFALVCLQTVENMQC